MVRAPTKQDFKPNKTHGFTFAIFLAGCLLPPIAVALRFGFGSDFLINTVLCICGYFPCHFHNFYIQNIRNNTNKKRTPKWVKKMGLVDDSEDKRRAAKSQWAGRYNERNPHSTHVGAALEEGEEGENYVPVSEITEEEIGRRKKAGLWKREDEEYYNQENEAPNQSSWHYPANFEGTDIGEENAADRFTRSREARDSGAVQSNPGFASDSYVSTSKSGKKSSKSKSAKRANIAKYAPSSGGGGGFDNPSSDGGYGGRSGGGGGNIMDSSYDNDVPEWGRDYGAAKNTRQSEFADKNPFAKSSGGNGYGNGYGEDNGYGDYGNGNGNASGGAKKAAKPVEENWDHQF